VDGVIIATPNNTHADIAVECLGRGVSTLIEKPLAASVDEGRRIQHAAEGSGAIAAVGYVTRFRENIQFMRTLLRTRAFGRVRRFAYQFGTKGGWAPVSAYNLDRASTGGGVLVVTGTHFLDRMLDWFGYPADATLRDDSRGGPEANAVASFVFDTADGPLRGTVRFSKSVNLEAGLVLDTEAGIVIFKDRPDAEVTVRPAQTSDIEQRWSHRALGPRRRRPAEFVLQLQDFIQAARTRGAPMVPAEKGLESLRLIEQLYANSERLPDAFYERANQAAVIS
jgi:predicted dehydrogenase